VFTIYVNSSSQVADDMMKGLPVELLLHFVIVWVYYSILFFLDVDFFSYI
jgi:hypothetical protein